MNAQLKPTRMSNIRANEFHRFHANRPHVRFEIRFSVVDRKNFEQTCLKDQDKDFSLERYEYLLVIFFIKLFN